MTNHQLTLLQIKSDLMDLWTSLNAVRTYEEWFEVLKKTLTNHFDIEYADFFVYDKEKFMPIKGYRSALKGQNAVRFDSEQERNEDFNAAYLERFKEKGFAYADDFVIFEGGDTEPLGLLLIQSTDKWSVFSNSPSLNELKKVVSRLILTVRKMVSLVKSEKNYKELFSVTELFNSTMDSQLILNEIVNTFVKAFPAFQTELLLSHEKRGLTRSYKLFDYTSERPSAVDAYVSGEMTVEEDLDLSCKLINAPIKGRQGIYGLLQIKTPFDFAFSTAQKNYIRMLANTAGNALENASLYDQSHRVIEDLQLVNETSRKLNGNMDSAEMIVYLRRQLLDAFKPNEIGFVFCEDMDNYRISPLSTDFFSTDACSDYLTFVRTSMEDGEEALFEASFNSELGCSNPYESVISIPFTNQEKVIGFVILLHTESYFFSFDNFKLMRSLIGHSSLALANSLLRDQLQDLVNKDHLTKLYTRNYLDNAVEESIINDQQGVFVLIDIDNFKKVNDTYGHASGDLVLKQIASYIQSEIIGIGIATRWGGEELALYLPSINIKAGAAIAKQLVLTIPTVTNPKVTVSVGIHSWTSESRMTFEQLFHFADEALYAAKNNGKNQVRFKETSSPHL
ncbi:diguanylate cyclase [Filibacter tadaridae]|uniref:Putative diguanylate cyclase YdaM n=1 Tax=Filibacter tadaridae TaxID=2483811 RepID=A0A3P5X960_9BACL|nr:diguanylate cyclase [Filibacter tadaridae]VDC26809.1 putative diguanylate cyclase YdaM [Filibacter tadaridae]